ncbi:TetR family transcriptional regulator [Dactylosporangium sp. AC04546]|uniref:TetR family transcriptional regulator n=1 Tax=Dactylosporangium sp. AC04546 TaxID=2862460 RepID=UPI001EDF29B3|nr:TetR family transcriptional regulator [Dactylosporangium sp. AC04546]WVK87614.1 TetR family transcriptional regulator [Dactylosporangium sp. AC04546]
MLDAAVRLAGEGGPAAVTVAAVARAVGGPSGSVYHRFAGRPALAAALWNRTVARFQEGWLAALAADPAERAVPAAAGHVVAWSRAHEAEARVLLYGAADFDEPGWAPEDRAELRRLNARIGPALRDLAARLRAARLPAAHEATANEATANEATANEATANHATTDHATVDEVRGAADLVELLTVATIDLPGAVVRRHLRRGQGIPAGAEVMVSRAAASLLVLETCL